MCLISGRYEDFSLCWISLSSLPLKDTQKPPLSLIDKVILIYFFFNFSIYSVIASLDLSFPLLIDMNITRWCFHSHIYIYIRVSVPFDSIIVLLFLGGLFSHVSSTISLMTVTVFSYFLCVEYFECGMIYPSLDIFYFLRKID